MTSTGPGFGSLAGLKVVDLTVMLSGPFCSQLLADHGADVVKIEPLDGEMARHTGPFVASDRTREFGVYFQSINRNKRSIAVDLKCETGRRIVLALVARADVLIENFRSGVMERLGLSYEALKAINPRLVYASIRGFGDSRTADSPYLDWPAFDVVAQAMGGVMSVTGADRQSPTKVGPGLGDIAPALFAAFGILAALRHAEATGIGQYVDVAMADSVLAVCERIIYTRSALGRTPHPEGNHHPMLCPFGIFPARDGWITLACHATPFWLQLCTALELPDLGRDPRFTTQQDRSTHRREIARRLELRTAELTKAELGALLGGVVPFGPVLDAEEIMADRHFAVREMVVPVAYPELGRSLEMAGVPVRMTGTPGGIHARAPRLGEHTEAILGEAGFGPAEIAAWLDAGAIKQAAPSAGPEDLGSDRSSAIC
jgi:crotonobetainyl-CoA:carnitine CoA-transferase CaiB-like acyl-CoA transferase